MISGVAFFLKLAGDNWHDFTRKRLSIDINIDYTYHTLYFSIRQPGVNLLGGGNSFGAANRNRIRHAEGLNPQTVSVTSVENCKEWNLDKLPLLRDLKENLLKSKPHICIERARHITDSLRESEDKCIPIQLRYAEAQRHFMSKKEPYFFDDNLLAGTTTSKPFGAPLYPELTGLTIWPELDTIGSRQKNPLILSPSDAELLDLNIFPYWMERNVLEAARKKHNNPRCMKLFERLIFFLAGKSACVSHTVPNYSLALKHGLQKILADALKRERDILRKRRLSKMDKSQVLFYRSVRTALAGVLAYAQNLSAKARELARTERSGRRRANLLAMAKVCDRVPASGARTFREAVNSLWLLQIAIHAENINMAISPGRLDQVLFPFYKRDISRGVLTIRETIELIGCLWLKLNDNTNVVPESAEEMFGGSGTVPAVTVGGVDKNNRDAVNDLTYVMLRVTELLGTRDPSLNARFHYKKNSERYRNRVAEVISSTKAVPAVHNDVAAVATLLNQGLSEAHARDYAIIGCVELASGGRSYDASSSIILNLPAVLELTLYRGKRPRSGDEQIGPETEDPARFLCFAQFWEAFKEQFAWLAGQAIELNELLGRIHQQVLPSPLLSALFEGPISKGRDLTRGGAIYNSSGATHIGFADTVDSLSAIEQSVFIDKKFSMPELLCALKDDFVGHEKIHAYLKYKSPKFGARSHPASKNAQNLLRFIFDFYQSHVNYRGGVYRPAYWTMTNHAGQGRLCGALPSGRGSGQAFASGITPVSGIETDLSGCLSAVASLDSMCIPGGEALNLKFPAIDGDEDVKRLAETIESYFRLGGLQIQFNIVSAKTLIEAKNHPERYPALLVRVSGYSAYFNDLNDAMKDEIITRTSFDIQNGRVVSAGANSKPGNYYPELNPTP